MENGSLRQAEIRRDRQASGPRKHGESLPKNQTSGEMGAAIQRLTPGRISRADLLDLFDRRADYKTIQSWRYGWNGAPQWAVELIQGKLAARARADLAAGAKLKAGKGKGWNKCAATLAAWRERKARERDEQEKAAHEAALLDKPN